MLLEVVIAVITLLISTVTAVCLACTSLPILMDMSMRMMMLGSALSATMAGLGASVWGSCRPAPDFPYAITYWTIVNKYKNGNKDIPCNNSYKIHTVNG